MAAREALDNGDSAGVPPFTAQRAEAIGRRRPDPASVHPGEVVAAEPGPMPVLSRLPGHIVVIGGLALTSGTIHLVAAGEHVGISWMLGAFFAVVGAGQWLAAWWIFRTPEDERMLKLAALGSLIVSLLWVFSRTTGIPFGPDPGRASVGVADTITTVQQVLLAAIVVALLRPSGAREGRLAWMGGGVAIRATFALLTTTMLMAALGGHQH